MTAMTEAKLGRPSGAASDRQEHLADHDADQRAEQRRAHRRERAEQQRQQDDRDQHADELADRGRLLGGDVDDGCRARRPATPSPSRGLRGLDERLAVLLLEVGGLGGVADVDGGDAAVLRELRLLCRTGRPPTSTPSSSPTFASASSIAGSRSSSVPSSTLKTIVASAPANAGLWSRKRSSACLRLGARGSRSRRPPRCPRPRRRRAAGRCTTMAAARPRFQCWVSERAMRASRWDTETSGSQIRTSGRR